MIQYQIPKLFFEKIAEKGNLYSRIWIYWLGGYVDELFEPDFIEKQAKIHSQISNIREIYEYGVQFLRQDFKIVEPKEKKESLSEKIKPLVIRIIEYLNSRAETTFNPLSKSNYENISARINEGYGYDDFKKVIDLKVEDWKGTDFERYLRPITLFSKKKFENYLNGSSFKGNTNSKSQFTQVADSVALAKQILGIYKD